MYCISKYLFNVTVQDYRLWNVLIYEGACCTAKYSQILTEGQYCVVGFDTNSVPLLIMVLALPFLFRFNTFKRFEWVEP